MNKTFEFRTKRKFNSEYEYKNILSIIDRIKSRCPEYIIRDDFGKHPANAFDYMGAPENENENYLYDDYMLFFDSADNLVNLNHSLSGKYGWNQIADVVGTQSGVGANNWHWTLNSYKLKPEYAQLLIENLNILEEEVQKNYDSFLSDERKKEMEREAIRQSIAAIDTTEKVTTDEGGKTKIYTHVITFHDGERLTFIERNMFDVGVVVNPAYSVAKGLEPGGICSDIDGVLYWRDFDCEEGWMPIRELTENEITAIKYLEIFGKYANSGIWKHIA